VEMHAHIGVGLAVDGEFGGDLDIRVLEFRQFLFPIRFLELQEERAHGLSVVKRFVLERFDLGRGQLLSGLRGF